MNVITDHDIGKAYYINRSSSSSLLLAYKNASVMMSAESKNIEETIREYG